MAWISFLFVEFWGTCGHCDSVVFRAINFSKVIWATTQWSVSLARKTTDYLPLLHNKKMLVWIIYLQCAVSLSKLMLIRSRRMAGFLSYCIVNNTSILISIKV